MDSIKVTDVRFCSGDSAFLIDDGNGGKVKRVTVARKSSDVGRNDLCPCGSGKKYKKCCGAANRD